MAASLRHASHPLQLGTIQVVGTGYLCPLVVDALLAFLQVVGIVAAIGIDSMVVKLKDDRAHTVQEETVVGHHEQGAMASSQVALQPLYHLQIQMVGRLVENDEVWLRQQHVSQCHTLLLTATQLPHLLLQVPDLQLRQHLLGLQHLFLLPLMIETGVEHGLVRVELGRLLQEAHLQVTTEHDVAAVVTLLAGKDGEQRRLSRAVLRYQSHLLAFANGEADIAKQRQGAKRLGQVLYVEIGGHSSYDSSLLRYNAISIILC